MEQSIIEAEAQSIMPQNKFDIDGFIKFRQEFIEKVNTICVEGKDYHIIQGRKSLAKGGAEKIANIFGWQASFEKDTASLEMLGNQPGVVSYVCKLSRNGIFAGEGRGAAILAKNSGDPNKTLKMAQKSAFIDAVIRASGLSDFYTQDLGPEDEGSTYGHIDSSKQANAPYKANSSVPAGINPANADKEPSQAQLGTISKIMKQKGYFTEDLIDQGFSEPEKLTRATASECIGWLISAPSKVAPNGDPIE